MDSSKKILLLLFVSVVSAAADGFFDRHTRSERSNAYADQPARPYSYEYSVNDDYEGTKFNARESADGKVVTGSYQVLLPDGRLQTVTYTADHYSGYNADVQYKGEPAYPRHQRPSSYRPGF